MMSNQCPKCGDTEKFIADSLSLARAVGYDRGRADAIAELDKWNTGEPEPRDGMQIILKYAGDTLVLAYSIDDGWDCSCGVFGDTIAEYIKNAAYRPILGDATWQWREVRP